MRTGLFHKRIPTVFALFILMGGLITTAVLVQKGVFTTSQATPNEEPQNIAVSNITNKSFTVTFTTLDPTIAAVSLESENLQQVVYDARNPEGNKQFVSHFITVSNLTPKTTYSFTVLSNGTSYKDGEKNFTVTTAGGNAPSSSNSYALTGHVLLPDGLPGNDVLILVSIPLSAAISAVTDDTGTYSIPTDLIRNLSHDQIVTLVPGTDMSLTAVKAALTSKITYQYQPSAEIPTISLSQNYSFTAGQDETNIGTQSSLLTIPTGTGRQNKIEIATPKENQTFVDVRPQFKGTALPSTLVQITIRSDPITAQVRTDPNGNWAYRPAVALSPGTHTITIQAPDINGVMKSVTSSFTVFASGSQVAESATPSATPKVTPTAAPTATPTIAQLTPTATPTLVPSVSPGITATPSPTLTIMPSPTPTPTLDVAPTKTIPPSGGIPPTGSSSQALLLTTMSILFIVSGSVLLFIL